jgi:hypothetical protein
MAEDEQIAIIIKAIDEATETIKKIEKTLDTSSKNIKKQTEDTNKAFDKQMGSLLVLGNAANSVDRIMSNYQNMQLRLENSSERVANAQDRLRKAQYNLNKVMKSGKSSAEDVAEAQAEVTSASRGLTIAQNNLAKTQGQVVGTYISLGVESLNLIKSLPVLINSVKSLTTASMAFVATPIGATLLAVGAAVSLTTMALNNYAKEVKNVAELYAQAEEESTKFTDMKNRSIQRTNQLLTEQTNKLYELINGPIEGENQLTLSIAQTKRNVAGLELELIKATSESTQQKIQDELDAENLKLAQLEAQYNYEFTTYRDLKVAETALTSEENAKRLGIYMTTYTQIEAALQEFKTASIQIAQEIANEEVIQAKKVQDAWEKAYKAKQKLDKKKADAEKSFEQVFPAYSAIKNLLPNNNLEKPDTSPVIIDDLLKKKMTVGDAIIRPNGQVIETDPRDTLIATKNGFGGGVTVIIEGDVFGLDAEEISRALKKELSNKLSI